MPAGAPRGGLDEVHADQVAAHAYGGHRGFARGARQVVGAETLDARIVEFAQIGVGGEAARGEHDPALGADHAAFLLGVFNDHAHDVAFKGLFADDFDEAPARDDLDAQVVGGLRQNRAVALSLREGGNVGARIEGAEDLDDVVLELHAEAFEPSDGAVGVFAENANAFGVASEVACGKRLLHVVFRAVLDALTGLTDRVGRIDEALGNEGVAARERHLFVDDDVLGARLGGLDGGGHAGAARADDDDFVGFIPLDAFGAHGVAQAGDAAGGDAGGNLQKAATVDGGHKNISFAVTLDEAALRHRPLISSVIFADVLTRVICGPSRLRHFLGKKTPRSQRGASRRSGSSSCKIASSSLAVCSPNFA